MFDFFVSLSPIYQALIASLFTWAITSLGSAVVFFFKEIRKGIMDALLGFSAGVMIAASFWSLLSPAIEMAESLDLIPWLVAFSGFACGGLLLYVGDKIYVLAEKKKKRTKKDGPNIKRCLMLVVSITLHNIPEGLVIGVAFGSLAYNIPGATVLSAITLAIGIGLQNFPEGSAVSLPLRREGFSRAKSFFYGQASGIVEPISAIIGAILVMKVQTLLPYLLSFAAGAMIYVVVEELIPEASAGEHSNLGTLFFATGFTLMLALDVALA